MFDDIQPFMEPGQTIADVLSHPGRKQPVDLAADSIAIIDAVLHRCSEFMAANRDDAPGAHPNQMTMTQLQFARVVLAAHMKRAAGGTPHTGPPRPQQPAAEAAAAEAAAKAGSAEAAAMPQHVQLQLPFRLPRQKRRRSRKNA